MFLRAALHVHSDWSYDGRWTLGRIAGAFSARGYDLVLVTEHDQGFTEERRRAHREACQKASTERVLMIPGIEYSDPANRVHTLVWGDVPFLGSGQETQHVLERATEHGGVCVFAHPSRRAAWQVFQREWLKHLAGIEIWNRKTDGWSPSRDAGRLIEQTGAPAVVGMDFHSRREFFPLALQFHAEGQATEPAILEALRAGSYHADVFGMDVKAFTGGIRGTTVGLLESNRRGAAKVYRASRWCASALKRVVVRSTGHDTSHGPAEAAAGAKH